MGDVQNLRVLLADDDTLVGRVITDELREIGAVVVGWAKNGAEAVALVHSLRPDVALLDIEMPELDGLAAARRIQEECPTPLVVLTGHEESVIAHRAADAGAGAYLVKPPKAADLERAILISRARFADLQELRRLNAELKDALAQVKTLSGLLPICASCKKIRDSAGRWHRLETYMSSHAKVEFSHGVCPECMARLYPDVPGE